MLKGWAPPQNLHTRPGDLEIGPGSVVGVVALHEAVAVVGGRPEPVPARGEAGDVDVLIRQAPGVEVTPADRQPHREAEAGLGAAAPLGVHRAARAQAS